ncbi:hypothetical protein CesoFtcFv8_000496 [Champsocephalus esox]|uniref:Uncharacterized protein n=1 Tax=Champsocephalus esox TaxID=159716 RepID=A0AAN8DBT4_9TELE|nr:hypothetical protein CesoFtcFv8_000496 [Champsocephalus esox]
MSNVWIYHPVFVFSDRRRRVNEVSSRSPLCRSADLHECYLFKAQLILNCHAPIIPSPAFLFNPINPPLSLHSHSPTCRNHYDGHSNMNQTSERRAAADRRDNYSRRSAKTTREGQRR